MKPKPHTSVKELLSQANTPPISILPYDTYLKDRAGFITFAVQEDFVSLPLDTLGKAALRSGATSIALEFRTKLVRIAGSNLAELFEDILLGRVRVIRTGRHPLCSVDRIQVSDATVIQPAVAMGTLTASSLPQRAPGAPHPLR